MVAESTFVRSDEIRLRTVAALSSGEVIQIADGRAAVYGGKTAAIANEMVNLTVRGVFALIKTAGIVLLDGMPCYWDHSANAVTFRPVNDRDFFLGTVVGDTASAAVEVLVNLNVAPRWTLDAIGGPVLSVPTGTQAVGAFGYPKRLGSAAMLELTGTNEAQCVDMLTVDRVAVGANPIVQAIIRVPTNGSGAAVDFNVGLANGTSTTDADAVAEHCFFHIDGASLAINAQSKDGTTTVAAVDTTKVITAGSAVANRSELWIDARDPSDIQLYVDAVNVLPASVFRLDNATGPLGLLSHLEKTTGTTTGQFVIDALRALTAQQ